jgi:ATPase
VEKYVVDTSIIIDGEITKLIEAGTLTNCEIIIPVAVLDELQSQASQHKDYGFVGLEEIKKIRELAEKNSITLRFEGERPSMDDIKLARHGRWCYLLHCRLCPGISSTGRRGKDNVFKTPD